MQIIGKFLIIMLLLVTEQCLAAEKIFGDDAVKSCVHGAADAQLKQGGLQALAPATVALFCLCQRDELNRTVIKADMDSALKGNTTPLDAKFNDAIKKCVAAIKSNKEANESTPVTSNNWIRAGGGQDGSYNDFVNIESIRKEDSGLVRMWIRREHSKIQKTQKGKSYSIDEISIAANCQERSIAFTTRDRYDKKSNLVETYQINRSDWSFHEVTPDSLGDVIIKNHCQ